jgi:hypothetical protein
VSTQHAFVAMMIASGAHVLEEYVYPGGFLKWMRLLFPRKIITPFEAVIINGVFLGFVVSPLFHRAQSTPIVSLSIASLLLANGLLHVAGTFITKQYSPGAVTSVIAYFPSAVWTLIVAPAEWHMTGWEIALAFLLGVSWQAIPLVIGSLTSRIHSAT